MSFLAFGANCKTLTPRLDPRCARKKYLRKENGAYPTLWDIEPTPGRSLYRNHLPGELLGRSQRSVLAERDRYPEAPGRKKRPRRFTGRFNKKQLKEENGAYPTVTDIKITPVRT